MFKHLSITNDTIRAKKFFEDLLAYTTTPYTLNELFNSDINSFTIADVRAYDDYNEGHIPFAIHLPSDKIAENLHLLDKEKPTILYCYEQHCHLAKNSAIVLLDHYYPVIELEGGFDAWKKHGYDIVKTDSII